MMQPAATVARAAASLLALPSPLPLATQHHGAVHDATLRDPPPEEWFTYGRDHAETHDS